MTAATMLSALRADGVRLWHADLDDLASRWTDAALARVCAEEELAQAARSRAPDGGRRRLVARATLRGVLGQQLGVAPGRVPLAVTATGKPFVPGSRVRFSISHGDQWMLLALADGREIGADVEVIRTVPEALDIAQQHLPASELAAVLAAPPGERDRAFMRGWTRAEAIGKAAGEGLLALPDGITCDDGDPDLARCGGRLWRVRSHEAMDSAWAVALEETTDPPGGPIT